EEVSHAELTPDFHGGLRRVAVAVGAGARDDLERGQRREFAADLVGDAVGEIRVGGIARGVERKYREAPRTGRRGGGRAILLAAPREQRAHSDEQSQDQ